MHRFPNPIRRQQHFLGRLAQERLSSLQVWPTPLHGQDTQPETSAHQEAPDQTPALGAKGMAKRTQALSPELTQGSQAQVCVPTAPSQILSVPGHAWPQETG